MDGSHTTERCEEVTGVVESQLMRRAKAHFDRLGIQGNCISKEREEFDEIILIPGGFFEFSA
jgi:hypothetical protein